MTAAIKVFPDTYVDSVVQLRGMRAMREVEGVEWASAAMATPANLEILRTEGVEPATVTAAGSNDFFLVVRASTEAICALALAAGETAVTSSTAPPDDAGHTDAPSSLREAVRDQPDSNVAVISVPGDYAALAAVQALSADLHVLLFSDNVSCRQGDRPQGPRALPGPPADGARRRNRDARRRRPRLRQRRPAGAGRNRRGSGHRRPGGHVPARPLGGGGQPGHRRRWSRPVGRGRRADD